jgi:hypothetical protein
MRTKYLTLGPGQTRIEGMVADFMQMQVNDG